MKTLALATFKIQEQEVKYADLLKNCVNQAPDKGFTPDLMEKRIRVLKALNASTDTLELEDADVQTLKECVAEMRWAILSEDILKMCDAVKNL